jgi:hypothetical protein
MDPPKDSFEEFKNFFDSNKGVVSMDKLEVEVENCIACRKCIHSFCFGRIRKSVKRFCDLSCRPAQSGQKCSKLVNSNWGSRDSPAIEVETRRTLRMDL